MLQRTITSAVILALMLVLVIFSGYIVYPIALAILSMVAVMEILRVMGSHKRWLVSIPACILSGSFPILAYFVTPDIAIGFMLTVFCTLFVYLLWLMAISIFSKGKISFNAISEIFVSVIYVTVSFTSLSLLRYLNKETGAFNIVLVFMVAWACDVFAYLVGSLIGKHKLIPEISPKKTVEGAIGGVVFTVLFCLTYGFALDKIVDNMSVNYVFLAICGVILPIVSQLGDLTASLIKREYGVKDYGKIFPGHGGVMDRFDSVVAVSTILLILCILFPPFAIV